MQLSRPTSSLLFDVNDHTGVGQALSARARSCARRRSDRPEADEDGLPFVWRPFAVVEALSALRGKSAGVRRAAHGVGVD
jgi:hypothetical protein